MNRPDLYQILGVSSSATQKEIEAAYRQRVRTCHPDICRTAGAEERMKDINAAFETLSDPEKRSRYDQELERTARAPSHWENAGPSREPTRDTSRHKPPPAPEAPRKRSPPVPYAAGLGVLLLLFILFGIVIPVLWAGPANATPVQQTPTHATSTLPVPRYPVAASDYLPDTIVWNITDSQPFSLVPGPVATPPSNLNVVIQIDKDPITNAVMVSLAGGDGQPVIKKIRSRVYRSDGLVLESSILPYPSRKANEVKIPGTSRKDRAEITVVYYSGSQYTIIDRLF